MEHSSITQNRRSRRSNVLLAATLEAAGGSVAVKLRNLSAEGALVEGVDLPEKHSKVLFLRNEIRAGGRVVWVSGKHAGVAFDEKLEPEQEVSNVPKPRQRIVADFRRPGFQTKTLTPEERKLVESWAMNPSRARPGE